VEATGGKVFGTWKANKVCIDTRKIEHNDLFIAFKGVNVDGHNYVAEALEKGASAAMVEYIPENVDPNKLLLVENCKKALEKLAVYNRARLNAKVISVTGSVGKSSTKEMLYLAFSALGETYRSQGNYNNHLGLPISLASIPLSTQYVILEMGISNPGEMIYLTELAGPDLAIITNVVGVHLANFGSKENLVKAKSEIFIGLSNSGAAIINKDSDYSSLQVSEAQKHKASNIITFGKNADVSLIDYRAGDEGVIINADVMGANIEYKLTSYGLHHIYNSLAALSAVKFLGGDVKKAAANLIYFKNLKGRGEVNKIKIGSKNITLIDDSYNAHPVSIRASLNVVGSKFALAERRIAILGDMPELGPDEAELHKGLVPSMVENKIDKMIAIGPLFKQAYDMLPVNMQLAHFSNVDETLAKVLDFLSDGDVILIKGANRLKLSKLVDYLKEQQ
jgi:UDP-N-acetylmuramoyl-tripeptide--D-alanyl-D-alanine ligase